MNIALSRDRSSAFVTSTPRYPMRAKRAAYRPSFIDTSV